MKKKYWITLFLLISFFSFLYMYNQRERKYEAKLVHIKDSRDRNSSLNLSFFYPYLIDSIQIGPIHFNSDCLLRDFNVYPSWTEKASAFTDDLYHNQDDKKLEVSISLSFDYFLNFDCCSNNARLDVPVSIYRKKRVRHIVLYSYAYNIDTEIR